MRGTTALVMAAGKGTRMHSELPKLLHPVCGPPMIAWPVQAARACGAERVVVILGPDSPVAEALPGGVEITTQEVPDGTGGAVRAAREVVRSSQTVLVVSGDNACLTGDFLAGLLEVHAASGAAATMVTVELEDPTGYGRVVRGPDGSVERVAETKAEGDASAAELEIREVNAGIYAFDGRVLVEALARLRPDNAQSELYLPDVLPIIAAEGGGVETYLTGEVEATLGVNTRADLAVATEVVRRRVLRDHMLAGVTVVDPGSTWIEAEVELAADVTVEPFCVMRGDTRVGPGSVIGPMTTLVDVELGAGVHVPQSHLVGCRTADRVQIGPFAYLRPGTELGEESKVGTFVEVKGTAVGRGSKVPHLSYVGDAEIGEGSNLGAGTITANYDGFRKHRTVIGDEVRIGVDTSLVAPVRVGDRAYTGAGSVITQDVPDGSLGVGRARQRNVEGYADRAAKRAEEEEGR